MRTAPRPFVPTRSVPVTPLQEPAEKSVFASTDRIRRRCCGGRTGGSEGSNDNRRSPTWAAAIISDRSEVETLPPAGALVSRNDAGRVVRPASRRNHFPDDGFAKAVRESVHVGSGVVGGLHLFPVNQGDRRDGNTLFAPFETEPLSRGRFDGNRVGVDSDRAGDRFAHPVDMGGRSLGRCIEIVQSTLPTA